MSSIAVDVLEVRAPAMLAHMEQDSSCGVMLSAHYGVLIMAFCGFEV